MTTLSPVMQIAWIYDLYRLGLEAVESNDISELYQRILQHILDGFQGKNGSLALRNDDGRSLTIVAGIDLPAGVIGSLVGLGEGVLGWVAKEGMPLLLNGDVSNDPRFQRKGNEVRKHHPSSAICWPLKMEDRVVGAISVNRPDGMNHYDESDVEQGTVLLSMVSLALGNIQMHCDLKHRFEELKQANLKLEEAQNQLLQSEKMASIGQLAAGVAHEINNPIGYVNSNLGTLERHVKDILSILSAYEEASRNGRAFDQVEALKEKLELDYLKEDIVALLQESEEGIGRVKKIVQDLKDFSHVDEAEWQHVDLHKGLESTLNIVHNEIKYKANVVREYGNLPEVECLPSQLNQVFMNLLVNAAHAIENTGVISVRTGTRGDVVWVEIEDTGHGIPKENMTRIFDPFFTTKPVGKGTGLGLSLSYSIVQKHQGKIEVESEVGKGTIFRVTLPVMQPETKDA